MWLINHKKYLGSMHSRCVVVYMVVKQATDESFYHDVASFPFYLDHPVSLKNLPLSMAH